MSKQKIKSIPKLGDKGDDVITLKAALIAHGSDFVFTNDVFGPQTLEAVKVFQKSIGLPGSGNIGPATLGFLNLEVGVEKDKSGNYPKWYLEAKKYEGKNESDSKFNKFMSGFWKLVGLDLGTIQKNWAAWCGLAMAVALSGAGYAWQKDGAAAKNWAKYGQKIEWKTNGIPRGAILHINHGSKCDVATNNHVGQADGDCTPEELMKPGAKINVYGGNQANAWKVSSFPVEDICAVRWPLEEPLPAKITKSDHCSGAKTPGGESTK